MFRDLHRQAGSEAGSRYCLVGLAVPELLHSHGAGVLG